MKFKHLNLNQEPIYNHVSMEGLWDSIKNLFSGHKDLKNEQYDYHDSENISYFFKQLEKNPVKFKEGTIKSSFYIDFLIDKNGKLINNWDHELEKLVIRLTTLLHSSSDTRYSDNVKKVISEANKISDPQQFTALYNKYKLVLEKTPALEIKNDNFLKVSAKDFIDSKVHSEWFWNAVEAKENIDIPCCTKYDVEKIKILVTKYLDVYHRSQDKIWDLGYLEFENANSIWYTAITENNPKEALKLAKLVLDYPESGSWPYLCNISRIVSFEILGALCYWVHKSIE